MNKKNNKWPLRILIMFFIIYIGLFIANASGYYEARVREKVGVTEDGIKEFEEKVQNGEEIDIKSFLQNEREDYSSTFSHIGDGLTYSIEKIASKSINIISNIIKSLF